MKTYVLYHANCTDGMGSYYSAWKKFGDRAEYIPVNYGQPVPDLEIGSVVYLLDFCYSKTIIAVLAQVHSKLVILDHHKTAEEDLKDLNLPNVEVVFDMTHSGAVITWNYFHPTLPVPDLLRYVEDRDLWTFKLDSSKIVSAALNVTPPDVRVWDKLVTLGTNGINQLFNAGEVVLKVNDQLIQRALKQVAIIKIADDNVPCLNSTVLMSELGEAMLKEYPDAPWSASYIIRNQTEVQFSLRSRVGSDVDVSAIAGKFGGGGHKHASGFITNLEGLMRILENVQLVKE